MTYGYTREASEVVDKDPIASAIDSLDLAAKVRVLTGSSLFALEAIEEIGLRSVTMSDGPFGLLASSDRALLLPNATLIAQSFDPRVAGRVGELLASEAVRLGVDVVLGPTMNLHRTPLGGRLFESFSEDPLLTGLLAASYVRQLQNAGISASPKHFVANEAETDRNSVNNIVDEATLRELYLLPFEIVVQDSNPWTIMAAYNQVNGSPATESAFLLDQVLRREWAWDGVVVSDWQAAQRTVETANGGLDLIMPGPGGPWGEQLVNAVEQGEVPESVVSRHAENVLLLASRVGALGAAAPPSVADEPDPVLPTDPEVRREVRDMAAGSMVVIKNDDGVLPLRDEQSTVAFIGRHVIETLGQGGGSALVIPPHTVTIAEAAAQRFPNVALCDGVDVRENPKSADLDSLRDPETGTPGIRVELKDSYGETLESFHIDGTEFVADPAMHSPNVSEIVVLAHYSGSITSPLQLGVRGGGAWKVSCGSEAFQTTLHAEVDGLWSEVMRPPTQCWAASPEEGDLVRAEMHLTPEHHDSWWVAGIIIRVLPRPDSAAIINAIQTARTADIAVVVVGMTEEQDTESQDKATLQLPGDQDTMVWAVAAAAKKTVVVVNSATPILMPWLDAVDAVLWAGYPGQEAGAAILAALTGNVEPAGRLSTTFPRADGEGPAWSVTPEDGVLRYTEGRFIGYAGWAQSGAAPLLWFGHGLGYGSWEYGDDIVVERSGPAILAVAVALKNTSHIDSSEVVQIYWRPEDQSEPTRLIGFRKVSVRAGDTVMVNVECDQRVQRRWKPGHGFELAEPQGHVVVARGLGDVRSTLEIRPS